MKKSSCLGIALGLFLAVPLLADESMIESERRYSYDYDFGYDDDNSYWDNGFGGSRYTHYCYTTEENGKGVLDNTFFRRWLDLPGAQRDALDYCFRVRGDWNFCQAHLVCREKSRP